MYKSAIIIEKGVNVLPLVYRIDVLAALKEKGFSSYRLRKEKIFGERVIQQLRNKEPVSWEVLGRLCSLLDCEVGDLLRMEREGKNE